jgi:UDP-glucose 4-epimerase
MRVVVVGATGNVGTSLVRVLADEPAVDSILGIARRRPELELEKTEWAEADIAEDELAPLLRGADAVVHLAWVIQPSHDLDRLWRINVHGSTRLFRAVAEAQVPVLVYASSVGAYSEGPKDRRVDESWPTNGVPTSFYARHKAEVERRLDRFEREVPQVRSVRLRPALIFKRESGSEQRRLFAGPLFPRMLARPGAIPIVPNIPRLVFQAVHSFDIAHAYRLALLRDDARGAYNVAAEPVIDPPKLAELLDARLVPMSERTARTLAQLTWRLHLQPTPAGWADMAFAVPLMDVTRVHEELAWEPERRADEALLDVLAGVREGAEDETPPLARGAGGPVRIREFLTGIGRR